MFFTQIEIRKERGWEDKESQKDLPPYGRYSANPAEGWAQEPRQDPKEKVEIKHIQAHKMSAIAQNQMKILQR